MKLNIINIVCTLLLTLALTIGLKVYLGSDKICDSVMKYSKAYYTYCYLKRNMK